MVQHQTATADLEPPTFTVIKMVSFRGRVQRSKIASTLKSDLYIAYLSLVPSMNRFHTAMQTLFVELGGHQITTKEVVAKPGSTRGKKIKTNEEQDNGFAFTREFGPRSNNRNQLSNGRSDTSVPKTLPSLDGTARWWKRVFATMLLDHR